MSTLSALGLFHTVISVLAIPVGLVAFLRDGKIEPRNWLGKSYVALMLIGSFTAFGIFHTGHFGPGHVLTVLTLALFLVGYLAGQAKWFGTSAPYVETFSYSASFFMLMVFATTETLTRLPSGHPFAANQDDPALMPVRLALLMTLVVGYGYQVFELWTARRDATDVPSRVAAVSSQYVQTAVRK